MFANQNKFSCSPDDKLIDAMTSYLLAGGDHTVGGGADILGHFLAPSLRLHLLHCLLLKFALKKEDLYLIRKVFSKVPDLFNRPLHAFWLLSSKVRNHIHGARLCNEWGITLCQACNQIKNVEN